MPEQKSEIVYLSIVDISAPNATSIHIINMVRELAKIGHKITLVVPRPTGPVDLRFDKKKVDLVYTPNVRQWRWPNSLNVFAQIPYLFKLRNFNALYLRGSPLSLIVVACVGLLGQRNIIIEYNGWFGHEVHLISGWRRLGYLIEKMQKLEARYATAIRVVTKELGHLLRDNKFPESNISVISNGTDLNLFYPQSPQDCRKKLGLPAQSKFLVFAGNLWPGIDLSTVIRALVLLKRNGKRVELLIAGEGISLDAHRRLAAQSGIEDQIHFMGNHSQDDVNSIIGAADIGLVPIDPERVQTVGASPLKLYEYLAAGRPVIANNTSSFAAFRGQPWIYLVKKADPETWAKAIVQLLEIDNLKVGLKARQYAEQHFGWDRRALEVSALIESVCKDST